LRGWCEPARFEAQSFLVLFCKKERACFSVRHFSISLCKLGHFANMFSQSDVDDLRSHAGSSKRAEIAARLGAALDTQVLSDGELKKAHDIVAMLAGDVAEEVRGALASALRASTRIPHSVAVALASDVDSVSLPILASSLMLTNDDLVAIVRRGSAAAQTAIAGRPDVEEPVSAALVRYGDEAAVTALMRNPSSRIGEDSFNEALDRFADSEAVAEGMAHRPQLPAAVAERLVTLVSDELQHYLITHHNVAKAVAKELTQRSREYAVLRVSAGLDGEKLAALAAQVEERGRLTPTLLLRALCAGQRAFFEAGMARLASVPVTHARALIGDQGPGGLPALYGSCGLPANLLPVFRAVLSATSGAQPARPGSDAQHLRTRIVDCLRVIMRAEPGVDMPLALECIREVTSPA
jgi:uncharacterized protein (DUF2336 family)